MKIGHVFNVKAGSDIGMGQQVIRIVVTVDENYVQHLGVMLYSLALHVSVPVEVYILSPGLSQEHQDKLEACVGHCDSVTLVHIKVDLNKFASLHICRHLSSVCYVRFALGDILPDSVDKVLYLDPDLLVLSDIYALWQVDLEGKSVGAVAAPFVRYEKIGLAAGTPYFNSGVLILDLRMWRESGVGERLLRKGEALGDRIFGDQDVLNIVFQGQWKKLPLKWNKTEAFYVGSEQMPYPDEEVCNAGAGGIVHFTGSCKPWHFSCRHPKRKLYWKYLLHTPWAGARLEDASFKSLLVKLIPFRLKNRLCRLLDECSK
jgi:lipopolysaccharide biosynthesis glycosyltransferase